MAIKIKFKKSKNDHNPFPLETLHERLIKDKAIDMRDNFAIENLDDGYIVVRPIDFNKLYK
ncbi:hypothetical protein ACIQXQ_20105 [Peribacillus sp. NPDC097198]|uniref:hypothetical protein n=1 Tax=Peribacillus sp. NPDC097198 TaxID=3364397 RepID=UPI0037FF0A90